jgi:hypothetical protein
MYNRYDELQIKLMNLGTLHTLAIESQDLERAKYLAKEYEQVEKQIERFEKQNGLE